MVKEIPAQETKGALTQTWQRDRTVLYASGYHLRRTAEISHAA